MTPALTPVAFDGLMAACGPFESRPDIAVAVSGGADSLALMHLLRPWVAARQGRLVTLTVDHGLRTESAAEAATVAHWAEAIGVSHHVLTWQGDKPTAALQAEARAARYYLLTGWCRDKGFLHLAIAHQLDDQRETVAMRRARQPAETTGLAGMSLILPRGGVRLIRPLLPVPGAVLRAHLASLSQDWIEDPSNRQTRFERIRWRAGEAGPLPSSDEIGAWGQARVLREGAVADLLLRSTTIHAAGFATVAGGGPDAEPAVQLQALGQLIAMVGGLDYLPARPALKRAIYSLKGEAPQQSLGGCLVGNWRGQGLICREAAGVETLRLNGGAARLIWDRRFEVTLSDRCEMAEIGPLGEAGLAEIGQMGFLQRQNLDIPPAARAALPALRDATGRLIAVPHLGFDPYEQASNAHFRFRPHYSVTSSGFTVAHGWPHTI